MRALLIPLYCSLWMGCGTTDKPAPGGGQPQDDTGSSETDTGEPGDPDEDADEDGYGADVDCDDGDPLVNPAAVERCDGVDNNCDGEIDEGLMRIYYPDLDLDAYGDEAASLEACERPPDYISRGGDCNDSDASINPDAEEFCDEVDNDCDGVVDGPDPVDPSIFYADDDGDGFGTAEVTIEACSAPDGYTTDTSDCDDTNPYVSPYGIESCDGVDNDCNGAIDEDTAHDGLTWYRDYDGDGFGDADYTTESCTMPGSYVDNDEDCNDFNGSIHPDASEFCNDIDDDCNGAVDEGFELGTYYRDVDGDGYGDMLSTTVSCMPLSGYAAVGGDCDDTEYWSNPGMSELCDDIDNDCDGIVDEDIIFTDYVPDDDGDGYGDAFGPVVTACLPPSGHVVDTSDCDDGDSSTYPGSAPLDSPTACMTDFDGDDFGDDSPASGVVSGTDCDDTEYWSSPGLAEFCDDIDNDCDGIVDEDITFTDFVPDDDGDGYGDAFGPIVTACLPPAGHVVDTSDCDDGDSTVNPGEVESCNGVDDDCDGTIDEELPSYTYYMDADDDGFGEESTTITACATPPGYSMLSTDCDDEDDRTYPGAYEFCDGEDDDCNGIVDDDCGYSRNFVLYVTDAFIGSAATSWLDSREDADAYCSSYAEDHGIGGSDFRIVYSTPDEDARDYLDYVPGLDQVVDRDGTDLGDTDIYDGTSPVLPDMKNWTIQGSGSDGRFSECSGSYPSGSWPICQFCDEKFTCGSSSDAMLSVSACCWTGTRAIICMGETD